MARDAEEVRRTSLKAEKSARLKYRRNVDNAYEPVQETVKIVGDTDGLARVEAED